MPVLRRLLTPFLAAGLLAMLPAALGAEAFRIAQDDAGRYWFEGPEGRFLSMGVNHIADHSFQAPAGSTYYDPLNKQFNGSMEAWRTSVFEIMGSAGMNTIGAWSDPKLNDGKLYETPILYVGAHAKERVISGLLPDFEETVRRNTREVLAQLADKSAIIGVFLDNEMAWYGKSPWDPNPTYTILEEVFTLPVSNRERGAAVDFLKKRYTSAEALTTAWGIDPVISWDALTSELLRRGRTPEAMAAREDFLTLCAESFFARSTKVVREEMPGVLILGTRFAGNAPDPVIRANGKYCDVISFNNYRPVPKPDEYLLARYWLLGQKPLMITEYSWRAHENTSGTGNTRGAGSVVATQAVRAANYSSFVESTMAHPMVIGMHWFEWADQSPQGRFDGEDSNYGMVDIHNRPYGEVIAAMGASNAKVSSIHAASTLGVPKALPAPPKVTVEPGQFPDRPAVVDLLKEEGLMGPQVFSAPDASVQLSSVSGVLVVTMETGAEWGCGVTLLAPKRLAVPSTNGMAADLDGYSMLVVEGTFPAHQQFQMIVDEAGVDAPGSSTFKSGAADDGESFAFEPVVAKGGPERFEFPLAQLQPRTVWGNQAGNRRVDLGALKGVALSFPGGTGVATVQLTSVRLVK